MYQIFYEPMRFPSHQEQSFVNITDEEYEAKYPSDQYTLIHKCNKFRVYLRKIEKEAFIENQKWQKDERK